jgi:hypothetical protein
MSETPELNKVQTFFFSATNLVGKWKEPFNQASFFNYDPVNPVKVNQFVIPPAVTIGGFAYPAVLKINLNTLEVNQTFFTFDFGASPTANLQIIYSQYEGLPVGF